MRFIQMLVPVVLLTMLAGCTPSESNRMLKKPLKAQKRHETEQKQVKIVRFRSKNRHFLDIFLPWQTF